MVLSISGSRCKSGVRKPETIKKNLTYVLIGYNLLTNLHSHSHINQYNFTGTIRCFDFRAAARF